MAVSITSKLAFELTIDVGFTFEILVLYPKNVLSHELNIMFSKILRKLFSLESKVDDEFLISIDSKGTDIRVRQSAQVFPSDVNNGTPYSPPKGESLFLQVNPNEPGLDPVVVPSDKARNKS
ncbi:hypothetical protein Tco_0458455 [Tanacetum coccineum]